MKYVKEFDEPVTLPLALGKAVHKAIEDKINGVEHEAAVLNGYIEADCFPELNYEEISELASRAKIHRNMGRTEVYFELPLDDCENAPIVRGYIDLLGQGNTSVIDWKTNRVMYHVQNTFQIGLYAWAICKMYKVQRVVGTLYFLRFGKASSHIFDHADMELARQWALGLANEINTKLELYSIVPEQLGIIFPPCPSGHCRTCPFALECYNQFGVGNNKINLTVC